MSAVKGRLILKDWGMDRNGNHVVRMAIPDDAVSYRMGSPKRAFSIQTNGNLPRTHSLLSGRSRRDTLTPEERRMVETEASEWAYRYGSDEHRFYLSSAETHPEMVQASSRGFLGEGYEPHRPTAFEARQLKRHGGRLPVGRPPQMGIQLKKVNRFGRTAYVEAGTQSNGRKNEREKLFLRMVKLEKAVEKAEEIGNVGELRQLEAELTEAEAELTRYDQAHTQSARRGYGGQADGRKFFSETPATGRLKKTLHTEAQYEEQTGELLDEGGVLVGKKGQIVKIHSIVGGGQVIIEANDGEPFAVDIRDVEHIKSPQSARRSYGGPTKGTKVTAKRRVEGHYSGYPMGNPRFFFEPGMVGTVVGEDVPPVTGRRKYLIVVEFHSPVTGKKERASLHADNWKPIRG